jgi:hypothetical protein
VSYQYLNAGFGFHQYGDTSAGGLSNSLASALRTDTTVSVSIPVYKGYGVFGGFYHSYQRFQFARRGFNSGREATLRFKGPIVGLFGSQPIPDTRASLYGNLGVGWLTVHPAQPDGQGTNTLFSTDSVMAYSVETGVNYGLPEFWKIKTSAQIGFRAQVLQQTFGASCCGFTGANAAFDRRSNDILWGPTFMLAAGF